MEDPSRLLPLWLPLWLPLRLPPRLPGVEACSTCSTSHLHLHPQPPTEAGVLLVPLRPPRPLLMGVGTLSVPPPPPPRL